MPPKGRQSGTGSSGTSNTSKTQGQAPSGAKKTAAKVAKATPTGRAASVASKAAKVANPAPKPSAPKRALGKVPAGARKWLLAELVVCVLLLVLTGVTGTATKDGTSIDTGSQLAIKGSALAGVFVVLGLVSAGGKGAQKAAGALGALITLAYLFNEREALSKVSDWAKAAGK